MTKTGSEFTVDPPVLWRARKRLAEQGATPDKDNAGDHLSNGARSLQLRCMMASVMADGTAPAATPALNLCLVRPLSGRSAAA
jgi:hypothetical protein